MTEEALQFQYGQRVISYTLSYSARKTVRVEVRPDGSVRVVAPQELSLDEVTQTVRHKAAWIAKQTRFFEQFQPGTPLRQYRSGETHRYLGRQYRLKVTEGAERVKLVAGFLEVSLPCPTEEQVKQALQNWYRQRAESYFRRILKEAMASFTSYALPTPTLKIRQMPTRWGSCTPNAIISLHPDLIKASGSCIEYVMVHELCHLIHRHHNGQFYELLGRILPDWQQRKQKLEQMMA